VSPSAFFLSLATAGGEQKERKEVFRGHPKPRQKAAALCTPLLIPEKKAFQVLQKLGMTHI
jgi:hypothetical protein